MSVVDRRSVVGIFSHPDAWMAAASGLRAKGVKGLEGWAPFPCTAWKRPWALSVALLVVLFCLC